jgi:hypothetical protein
MIEYLLGEIVIYYRLMKHVKSVMNGLYEYYNMEVYTLSVNELEF